MNPEKKDDNPFRYCGEYFDKETEEVYLRARYYQPNVGRFLTRDTYTGESDEPLSLHLYTYCANDGVNHVDPSGHDFLDSAVNCLMKLEKKVLITTKETRRIAGLNYIYNRQYDKKKGAIYSQTSSNVAHLQYGSAEIKDVGCELIAIYNTLYLLGRERSLADIIYNCEFNGYLMNYGRYGTNPYSAGDILNDFNVKYSVIKKRNKLKMKKNNIYIVAFWQKGGVKKLSPVHTIAVNVVGKRDILTYNDGNAKGPQKISSFGKLLTGRSYIIGYKIKKGQ